MYSDKKVEVKISNVNITHYINLGYDAELRKMIFVNCCDVTKTVNTKIYVICEFCGDERYIRSINYHNQIKKGGIYSCLICSKYKSGSTNLDKYGCICPLQNKEIDKKSKKTLKENYGVDNISKHKHIKSIRSKRLLDVEYQQKMKDGMINKFGMNVSKLDYIKKKKEKTTFKNYGVRNPSQSSELFEKSQISGKRIKAHENGLMYRGTYEKDFLDFCLYNKITIDKGPKIKYYFEGKERFYHSDFIIIEYNIICEIKSTYYYEKYIHKNTAKSKYSEKEGYEFLFIIDKDYEKIKKILNINI